MTYQNISGKTQFAAALIALVLMLVESTMYMLTPIYYEPNAVYILTRRLLAITAEIIPFVLLTVGTLLIKTGRLKAFRRFPFSMLVYRLLLDLVAVWAMEEEAVEALTFTMLAEHFVGFFILAMAILAATAAFASRRLYGHVWAVYIGLFAFLLFFLGTVGELSLLYYIRAGAYLLWFISLWLLAPMLTEENKLFSTVGRAVCGWFRTLISETMGEEEPEEEQFYEEDTERYRDYYYIDGVLGSSTSSFIIISTPENTQFIVEKLSEDEADEIGYRVLTDEDQIRNILEFYNGSCGQSE